MAPQRAPLEQDKPAMSRPGTPRALPAKAGARGGRNEAAHGEAPEMSGKRKKSGGPFGTPLQLTFSGYGNYPDLSRT